MRVTLADIKASRIPEAVNCPPADARVVQYVNEAVERLLKKGHWWGTTAKYCFSTTDGHIVLPRQIATIEKIAVSHKPIPVRDFWYEWLENGDGTRTHESGTEEAVFRNRLPVFSKIVPPDKKLTAICDLASDVGKEVLLLGFDDLGNWIRTSQDGVMSDGEVVVLAQTPGTTTTLEFGTITDIQVADDLDGGWWLYEYDTVLTTQRMIGQYQYDEIRPSYARYFIPSIGETSTYIEALVKLEFIRVKNDTDYVMLGNIPAIKFMCMAIKAEEDKSYEIALMLEAKAIAELNAELAHYLGDGRTPSIQVTGSSIGGNEPIETLM